MLLVLFYIYMKLDYLINAVQETKVFFERCCITIMIVFESHHQKAIRFVIEGEIQKGI